MIKTIDFLNEVRSISHKLPTYRTGGTGADGTCDCIGLIMGAMYRNGQGKYQLHSSNYFARYQTEGLQELDGADQLQAGMIVYKARTDSTNLNDRYKAGGTHHKNDPLDYYHVGVVTMTDPLEITHCTEYNGVNGIMVDYSINGWTHYGSVKGVEYIDDTEKENDVKATAVVRASSGSTVNMRNRPNKSADLIDRVPIGEIVTVNESAQGWSQITFDGKTGYMMSEFLQETQEQDEKAADDTEPTNRDIMEKLDKILEIIQS